MKGKKLKTESLGSYTQIPLKPAWAVTIHKSQGKTFSNCIIDIGKGAFATGQVYVALSRATSLEGIILSKQIQLKHIMVDRWVQKFMTQLQYTTAALSQSFQEKREFLQNAISKKSNYTSLISKPTTPSQKE